MDEVKKKQVLCMGDRCKQDVTDTVQYYPEPGVVLCERCNLKMDGKEFLLRDQTK